MSVVYTGFRGAAIWREGSGAAHADVAKKAGHDRGLRRGWNSRSWHSLKGASDRLAHCDLQQAGITGIYACRKCEASDNMTVTPQPARRSRTAAPVKDAPCRETLNTPQQRQRFEIVPWESASIAWPPAPCPGRLLDRSAHYWSGWGVPPALPFEPAQAVDRLFLMISW